MTFPNTCLILKGSREAGNPLSGKVLDLSPSRLSEMVFIQTVVRPKLPDLLGAGFSALEKYGHVLFSGSK